MKKLEIIIKPERLEELKNLLNGAKANGIMITHIMGYGNQKGRTQFFRGTEYDVNVLPKIKVETVVTDEKAKELTDAVCEAIRTGNIGDGKIFVYAVEDAVRIRTGERGEDAV